MTYRRSAWVFRRLLAMVYLAAFASYLVQVRGLIGQNGILPATELLQSARSWAGSHGFSAAGRLFAMPTVFWWGASDRVLVGVCAAGAALAALALAGLAPVIIFPVLWLGYLSLSHVSGEFLSYQWDALLLETGLLAIFLSPIRWVDLPGRADDPPRVARWLLWFLLFRLMFASGFVKLASGDPTWRSLTALAVHYETQPIPTPLAWYAHRLPLAVHKLSTALTLGIELAAPFLIVATRRLRLLASALLIGLQLLIAATGNYAFFNLLTVALCVLLIDDETWPGAVEAASAPWSSRREWPSIAAAVVTLPVALVILFNQVGIELPGGKVMAPLEARIEAFRSVNAYGLFAVMTTMRDEIVVEGSDDGTSWRAYEFRYKPGDLRRAPPWVAPHQPRLDWQMWFASLAPYEQVPWFGRFCRRLLEGSPAVLDLLAANPFPDKPPRFVRGTFYRYRFAEAEPRGAAWWTREELGAYSPVLTLQGGR